MRQGIQKTLSNNCEKLEHLYSSKIEVGSKKQRHYLNLLKFVMNFLIVQMRQVAPDFSKRVAEIYCGGSFFDGLKTDSQAQEFDMNILFRFRAGKTCRRCRLLCAIFFLGCANLLAVYAQTV